MKTKRNPIIVIIFLFWIVAVIGGVGAIIEVVGSVTTDGDVYNGKIHEVEINTNFFTSPNPTINSVLVMPQCFFEKHEDGKWGWGNMFFGFLSFLVLLLSFPRLLFWEGDKKSRFIFGIFVFFYTSYWAFITVFVLIKVFSGEHLTKVFMWG